MKYHVTTRFGFSPKASGFNPFGDATALAGEGGIGDEAAAVVVIEGDNVHFKQLHDGIFGGEARNVCQF